MKRGAPVLYRNTPFMGTGVLERGRFIRYAKWKGEGRIVVQGLNLGALRKILRRDDEGVTWCRGWASRSARALEVANALKPL